LKLVKALAEFMSVERGEKFEERPLRGAKSFVHVRLVAMPLAI